MDFAAGDVLKPGDHAQRRAFTAAGRPDQHHEFLVGDLQVDAAHGLGTVEDLPEILEVYIRHALPLGGPGGEAGNVVVHQERIDDHWWRRGEQRARH